MRPLHFLPPAVALVASGLWLGLQQQSISSLEKETVLLRQHVEAAKNAAATAEDSSLAGARANGKKAEDPEAIDWKDLADTMAKAESGGMPDMRAMMKLQTKLMSLSGAELTAALDEIAALDLNKDARSSLEGMLINLLAQKEPKLVLDRYLDRINDSRGGMGSWQMAHAFQQWSGKDGAAAVAWLDAQIAAGKFDSKSLDGKSQSRLQFEGAAIASLISSDVDAAGKRIAALPEDQRRELFQQGMFMNVKAGSEKNLAALVREHVPEKERPQALASSTGTMIHQGGYEKVGKFLDEIDATPDERKEVAKQAATSKLQQLSHQGKVDREAIDEMREWVAQESPDSVDSVTGESLGNMWNRQTKWEDNAKLIGELHAANPSDELLVSFLKGHQARQNRDAALEMAAKITDETKRAEVTARLEGKPAPAKVTTE
ncbi:hypothetical protein OKA05_13655 [Luteolibacter arcticus]|uniref:Uncharacterized protein n=1 Tax=Luteolibacter arcticus TaxID=1581411 RepID=A0ABT3GJA1_9BACT|nr:hypothetical protein [Luteolibacter arcticus]MCW1923605.1 hypothetical protein [Luteolibacter arcticus]